MKNFHHLLVIMDGFQEVEEVVVMVRVMDMEMVVQVCLEAQVMVMVLEGVLMV